MAADAAEMAALVQARHPDAKLVLMGESMGGAVLMKLAASERAPKDALWVFSAPAVWGRAKMNPFLQAALWAANTFVPWMYVSRPPPTVKIVPSDNREALIALSEDPLTIKQTRVGTTAGLVRLMDEALAAAGRFRGAGLFLYGAHDDLVPKPATRAAWEALPRGPAVKRAYYANGYHLLLRDLERRLPAGDIVAWVRHPPGVLPSGAEAAAARWLAGTEETASRS
jgi:alpha-beta hydrolase superfamily lysophospholipase